MSKLTLYFFLSILYTFPVAKERGTTSPRETRSAKKKRKKLVRNENYFAQVPTTGALFFSPPNQKANEQREKEEQEKLDRERYVFFFFRIMQFWCIIIIRHLITDILLLGSSLDQHLSDAYHKSPSASPTQRHEAPNKQQKRWFCVLQSQKGKRSRKR